MGRLAQVHADHVRDDVAGWLAICGIPIWAGFFSKDEILYRDVRRDAVCRNRGTTFCGSSACHRRADRGLHDADDVMTFYGTERFHDALPDETHAGDASYAEQTRSRKVPRPTTKCITVRS